MSEVKAEGGNRRASGHRAGSGRAIIINNLIWKAGWQPEKSGRSWGQPTDPLEATLGSLSLQYPPVQSTLRSMSIIIFVLTVYVHALFIACW